MGPIARLLLLLLKLCPSVSVNLQKDQETTSATTAMESFRARLQTASTLGLEDCPDFVDDYDPAIDDWPSQEALENHMTLAYLEHCLTLNSSSNDN